MNDKLTLNLGLRWDLHRPSWTASEQNSFLDTNQPNPGAGGLPGSLAFAGTSHGEASFGRRYPEDVFKKAFSPRVGIAYRLNDKTSIRAGYGIYFSQPFYAGWGGGIDTAGFTANPSFSGTQGGLVPAFILNQGLPQDFEKPPFLDSSFRNGQSIMYRDPRGNRLTYSQQWNLTVETQVSDDSTLSLAYVANEGRRLPSNVAPINTLNPQHLSLGGALFDEFAPGQASLHGVPLPYQGWVEQMQACAPSVSQALLPFPQFCGQTQAVNEYAGTGSYHSFQLKFEKQMSEGLFLLTSYTMSKLLTTSAHAHEPALGGFTSGVFSPFERDRAKSISQDDTPHVLSVAWVYELPFGTGKRFSPSSALNKIIGGWSINGTYKYSSGLPQFFRSGQCNLPGQLRAACIPGIRNDANPFATSLDNFDPGNDTPLLNVNAFEPVSAFEQFGYAGVGARVESSVRLYPYINTSVALTKTTNITEKLRVQLRAEFFNIFNQHILTASGTFGSSAFTRDISSPAFGRWTGAVTDPRNIQIGLRVEF